MHSAKGAPEPEASLAAVKLLLGAVLPLMLDHPWKLATKTTKKFTKINFKKITKISITEKLLKSVETFKLAKLSLHFC